MAKVAKAAKAAIAKLCDFNNATQTNSTWHYSCDEDFFYVKDFLYLGLVLLAHAIFVCLSKRDTYGYGHMIKRFRSCCWGRPGITFPLNMLDGYEQRLAYCAAFGSMTFELTSILWNPYGRFTSFSIGNEIQDNPLVSKYPVFRLMLLLVQVGICTFMFYPLFFSLATRYKFVGAVTGIVLSLYKTCDWLWLSTCLDTELDIFSAGFKVKRHLLAILLWPCILCMLVLTWQFTLIIWTCIRRRKFGEWTDPEPIALPHHIEHVRYLLGKKPLPWAEKDLNHVSIFNKEKFLANFQFRRVPGFRFPTRVVATFVVTVLALYQMGTQVAFQVYSGLKVVRRYVRCAQTLFPDIQRIIEMFGPYAEVTDYIMRYANILANVWIVTMVFNCLMAILYVYHICLCYRKHTLRVYRGERSMFPKKWIREDSHNILTSASRHAGLQIAYTIWGFVIIQIFLYLLVVAIIFLIFIPVTDFQNWNIIIYLLQIVVASLVLSQLIYFVQLIFNRLLFLQEKINPTDERKPLALNNRKAWYNVSFFFFFWNLFLGIISALMRIIKGLVLGVFFIPRIDRPVLMRGFETFDTGYYAYLSLLSVINAHDHPVAKVFVKCLIEGLPAREPLRGYDSTSFHGFEPKSGEVGGAGDADRKQLANRNTAQGTKRARYYWFLAYTLINNPDLLNYRKVYIDVADGEGNSSHIQSKHKIVLAIHRKKQGEKTSNMYSLECDA